MSKKQQQQSQEAKGNVSHPHENDDNEVVEGRSQGDVKLLADDGEFTKARHGTANRRSTRRNRGVPAQTLVEEQEKEVEARRGVVAPAPKTNNPSNDNPSNDNLSNDNPSDDNPSDDNPSDDNPSDDNPSDDNPSNATQSDLSNTASDEDEVEHFTITSKDYQKLMREICDLKGMLQSKSSELDILKKKHLKLKNNFDEDMKSELSKATKPLNKKINNIESELEKVKKNRDALDRKCLKIESECQIAQAKAKANNDLSTSLKQQLKIIIVFEI